MYAVRLDYLPQLDLSFFSILAHQEFPIRMTSNTFFLLQSASQIQLPSIQPTLTPSLLSPPLRLYNHDSGPPSHSASKSQSNSNTHL